MSLIVTYHSLNTSLDVNTSLLEASMTENSPHDPSRAELEPMDDITAILRAARRGTYRCPPAPIHLEVAIRTANFFRGECDRANVSHHSLGLAYKMLNLLVEKGMCFSPGCIEVAADHQPSCGSHPSGDEERPLER